MSNFPDPGSAQPPSSSKIDGWAIKLARPSLRARQDDAGCSNKTIPPAYWEIVALLLIDNTKFFNIQILHFLGDPKEKMGMAGPLGRLQ